MVDIKCFPNCGYCNSNFVFTVDPLRDLEGWDHINTERTAGLDICYSM